MDGPKFANTFNNDGSFLENFKKVTEAAKIKDEEDVVVDKTEIDGFNVNENDITPIEQSSVPEIEYLAFPNPPPTHNNVDNRFVSDLQSIPPPKIYVLNEIPDPCELDLNAIPKPELNLDIIKVPEISDAVEEVEDVLEGKPNTG